MRLEWECDKCRGRRKIASLLVPTYESSLRDNQIDCSICNGTSKINALALRTSPDISLAWSPDMPATLALYFSYSYFHLVLPIYQVMYIVSYIFTLSRGKMNKSVFFVNF